LAPRQANVRALLAAPGFLPLMALAALVMSSHALHDGFEVLRWEDGGIGPGAAGLLWSEGVLAEVVVFVLAGPMLLRRLGPAGAAALAASAGVVRWSVTAVTAWLPAMVLVEPLHGLTFALLHLACMQMLSLVVPPALVGPQYPIGGLWSGEQQIDKFRACAHLSPRTHNRGGITMTLRLAASWPSSRAPSLSSSAR
jgi:MFS transporter, PPP family, 3-phenylpropionic acid transporter